MLVLAWFPILNIYKSPLPLGYGSLIVLILWGYFLFNNRGNKLNLSLPRQYYVFWAWCAFSYIVSYLPQIKISAFIPGGLQLFVFSITLGFLLSVFDIESFKRHSRVVVVVTGVILILQDFQYATTGSRFIALLPFGELTDGFPMSDLIAEQLKFERSSSLFREPAHFAQYLLPLLCVELFCEDNKERFLTPYSIFIIIVLVLLRSGNGFLGLVILMGVKGWIYLKNIQVRAKIMAVLVIAPLIYFVVYTYLSTEVGSAMLERTAELENDDSASSYIRVYRGYVLYSELPVFNQLFGITNTDLMKIIPHTTIFYLFRGDEISDLYMNGIQMVLVHNGFVGLLFCMWLYISIGKKRTITGKMQLWLLLVLSSLGQTYLAPPMLYTTLLCMHDNIINEKQHYENSILCKT